MNYLGHLFFSKDEPSLMLANLYGDFVKGKDYTYLPEDVQRGVLLHRQIDDYVDHHPKVTELRLMLYKDLPKIAGIAIDLYFDHLLAKQWKFYHNKNLFDYIDSFLSYALNPNHLTYKEKGFAYPQSFIHLLRIINEKNIIKRYVEIEGLAFASTGLSKRLSFPNNLFEAVAVFHQHEKEISATFDDYMTDAIKKFKINAPAL